MLGTQYSVFLIATDTWVAVSALGSAVTAAVTAWIAWLNYRQRQDELRAQHEEVQDRQAERRERARQRRRHERTILLALQQETDANIRLCKQHAREPLALAAWRAWAEEVPEFAESVAQAAARAEPLLLRVNRAIETDKEYATIAEAQDAAVDVLFTLAGWIEHGLRERSAVGGQRSVTSNE